MFSTVMSPVHLSQEVLLTFCFRCVVGVAVCRLHIHLHPLLVQMPVDWLHDTGCTNAWFVDTMCRHSISLDDQLPTGLQDMGISKIMVAARA